MLLILFRSFFSLYFCPPALLVFPSIYSCLCSTQDDEDLDDDNDGDLRPEAASIRRYSLVSSSPRRSSLVTSAMALAAAAGRRISISPTSAISSSLVAMASSLHPRSPSSPDPAASSPDHSEQQMRRSGDSRSLSSIHRNDSGSIVWKVELHLFVLHDATLFPLRYEILCSYGKQCLQLHFCLSLWPSCFISHLCSAYDVEEEFFYFPSGRIVRIASFNKQKMKC